MNHSYLCAADDAEVSAQRSRIQRLSWLPQSSGAGLTAHFPINTICFSWAHPSAALPCPSYMTRIDPAEPLVLVLLALIACFVLYARSRHDKAALPLPPGPKSLPIVGNLLDLPAKDQPLAFHALCEKYGAFSVATELM